MVLIITGMHRSGTSLMASLFEKLGVDIGGNLVPADRHNPRGYFEDVDFLEFQRRVLQESCDRNDPGWHDWGWTINETLDIKLFNRYEKEALDLLNSRSHIKNIWGWKDPRTTLMLEFWHNLIPDVFYLFVFRYPWDVADSIKRLNATIFNEHPEYILPIWRYYNRKLLYFYQLHPDRCILFCSNYIDRFSDLVYLCQSKFNLPLDCENLEQVAPQIYDRNLFHQLLPSTQTIDEKTKQILAELQKTADITDRLSC